MFVAYALHRTRMHTSVTFTTLYMLLRLKSRFPTARGSSGHNLFLSAFMIASKLICDDAYSNKYWSIVVQGIFALREVNQMEREMCAYLDWELMLDPDHLADFEHSARSIYSGQGPYQEIKLPESTNKPASTSFNASFIITLLSSSGPVRKQSAPAAYLVPTAPKLYPLPNPSPESPSTPASSHSSMSSSTPSPF
jgi:hypothetical protein